NHVGAGKASTRVGKGTGTGTQRSPPRGAWDPAGPAIWTGPPTGRRGAVAGGGQPARETAAGAVSRPGNSRRSGQPARETAGPGNSRPGKQLAWADQPTGEAATWAAMAGETRTAPANSLPRSTGTICTFAPVCGAWIISP